MEVVDQSKSLMPWLQCLINDLLLQFSPFVSQCSFKACHSIDFSLLQPSFKDSPDSKIHRGCIWTFGHPLLRCNKVHVLFSYIRQRLLWRMARSTVLVKHHVLYLVTWKHSWCIMFNEWFQDFVNIKLRIDLSTFRDDPNLGFAVETNSSPSHETWCKRITFNKFEFWRIIIPSTDVADLTTTIAATQVNIASSVVTKFFHLSQLKRL